MSYVTVLNEDGSAERVEVETGISNDAYVEIKTGVREGEKIEISGT